MKKMMTGALSALFGTILVSSLTLNFCFYQKFSAEKKAGLKKQVCRQAKNQNQGRQNKPDEKRFLALEKTGHYGHQTVYARFHNDHSELVNLSPGMISIQPQIPFKLRSEPWYDHVLIDADFQPETTYTFLIRKGLEDTKDGKLEYDAVFRIRFPALPTRIKTLSEGLVLPIKRLNRTLPLEICNTDRIQIQVFRLYENNLLRFSAKSDWYGNVKALDYGKEIRSVSMPVRIPRNKAVHYALDLNPLLPSGAPGIYGLILTPSDRKKSGNSVQLAVAVTDLAPQCVIDNLGKTAFAAVHRLSDGKPCTGASVALVSRKFQELASGITDASGIVHLDYSRSAAGTDPQDYPDALLVKHGNDTIFQRELFSSGHSLTEFESGGNLISAEPRALVYTERGVYRPGEKVFVTAWIRNPDLKVYAEAPCLVKIHDPSGNVIYSSHLKTTADGMIHASFVLPEDMPGGRYTVWCQAPDESNIWGNTGFLAADFMPDRIKVRLKPETAELPAGKQTCDFTFDTEYYFGGKLEKPPYQFTVTAALAALRPEWRGWTVGSTEFSAGKEFSRSGKMADRSVKITYPGFSALGGKAFRPVALHVSARVSEPGGRAVTAHSAAVCHPTGHYLGLKQESNQDHAIIHWKFFPADKASAALPKNNQKIELTIFRSEWKYVLKKKRGKLAREWQQEKILLDKTVIDTAGRANGTWSRKLDSGSYEITALCGPMRTDIKFWHWYGEGGAHSGNPSVISCTTDKESYLPGETAKITLSSAADGIALIAAGDRKLTSYREYPVRKGRNTLMLELPPNAQTSACYAGITLIAGEQRQFGLLRFRLQQNRHKLNVSLESQETAMPQEKIKVKILLTSPDGKPQTGTVQLFAVDEGILALTRCQTPDIFHFFYGAYECGYIFTDIYGLLYPDLKIGRNGKIGGDGYTGTKELPHGFRNGAHNNARQSAPKPAVAVLPPVKVDGCGEVEIALPDHLGALRLTAVASAPERTGSAARILKMRDKLDILPSAPPVCAPGDEAELSFALFNQELKDGEARFELMLPGGRKITAAPLLKKGEQFVFRTTVRIPEKEGIYVLTAELRKDGFVKRKTLKLPVRLPNPAVSHIIQHTLKPGEKWSTGKNAGPVFAPDAECSLTVSGSCAGVLKDAVSWLNDYPYGCLEQTVSAAFPFLSADALEKCGAIPPEMAETAKMKVSLAAARILSMMLYNGSFPMWQGGTEEWTGGTVYAAHFLAAGNGFRDRKQKNMLSGYLKNLLQNASGSRYERAYAGYVLSLMKEKRTEILAGIRNILKSKKDDFAAFLAAAALLESGYSGEAYPHLKRLLNKEVWRLNDSSPHFVREAARTGMTLYILAKAGADVPDTIARLRQRLLLLIRPDGSAWGVTHDNAWAVLGLAELERRSETVKSSVSVILPDGRKMQSDPSLNETIKWKGPGTLTVENTGNAPVYLHCRIRGVPIKAQPLRNALHIRRTILRNGKAVTTARQGDLLTVRIQITAAGTVRDMVLSDLLPGGLEIEDDRFATRSKLLPQKQKKSPLLVKHIEKRPCEFILTGDIPGDAEGEIIYQVRAVSRGKYAMGSTSAEAMYDPGTRAFEPGNGFFTVQ